MALALAAGVTGCGDDDEEVGTSSGDTTQAIPDTATLDGRTFVSSAVTGHELVEGSELRLSFEGATMAVVAGCNTQTGAYDVAEDGTLAWSGTPASTMMACDEGLTAQDTWIAETLTEGLGATLDGSDLTLSGDDLTIELTEEADAELVGTTWTLEAIIANEAASGLPAGVEAPTLEFADDGTVAVFTGCNSGSGTFEQGDGTITFTAVAVTLRACEGDAGTVESAVLPVLDGEVEAVLDGQVLTITGGDTGLRYQAG